MSAGDKLIFAKASTGWPPAWCVYERSIAARTKTNFIIEGLDERCAPNTERTTVKPWVGSASWQEVFVLCWNGKAGSGRRLANQDPAFQFFVADRLLSLFYPPSRAGGYRFLYD